MNQIETNKKKTYYITSKDDKTMANRSETDMRVERYLAAFKELAKQDPSGFASLAPELLKRSVWDWRKTDPVFHEKLSSWLDKECLWTPFSDIIPKNARVKTNQKVRPIDKKSLPDQYAELIDRFEEKFSGDYHRWNAAKRDQFIILGMLALEGKNGVRQGKLVHHLGMNINAHEGIEGSNAIRAAKIALSRQEKGLSLKLFDDAKGNGPERLHAFADSNLADYIARFVLSHEASILLPAIAFQG